MSYKVNQAVNRYFWVYDGTTPVVGLVTTDFDSGIFVDGLESSLSLQVYEVDAVNHPGFYRAMFAPDETGGWYLYLKHSTYTVTPSEDNREFQVYEHDIDEVFEAMPQAEPGTTVLVGTDYGGTDNLRYVDLQGTGIADAQVWAYIRDEWDAGQTGLNFVKSKTVTDQDGRLSFPMVLSTGYWYSIVYFRESAFDHDVKEIYVQENP